MERKIVPIPQQVLDRYIGEYEIRPNVYFKITSSNGHLSLKQTNSQSKFKLFAGSENTNNDIKNNHKFKYIIISSEKQPFSFAKEVFHTIAGFACLGGLPKLQL